MILIKTSLSPGTIDNYEILHVIYKENTIRNLSILLDKAKHVGVKRAERVKKSYSRWEFSRAEVEQRKNWIYIRLASQKVKVSNYSW